VAHSSPLQSAKTLVYTKHETYIKYILYLYLNITVKCVPL